MTVSNKLDYDVSETDADEVEADLLIVPTAVRALKTASDPTLDSLGEATDIDLKDLLGEEGFEASVGQTMVVRPVEGLRTRRLLFVGIGDEEEQEEGSIRRALSVAGRQARAMRAARVAVAPPRTPLDEPAVAAQLVEGFAFGAYVFDRYKSRENGFEGFESLVLMGLSEQAAPAVAEARTIAAAVSTARDLVNEPASELTPQNLALAGEDIGSLEALDYTILDDGELMQQGFNLITAVGRGSANSPRLIHLVYRPDGEVDRQIAFVGKGVTFDTGGNSMKRPEHMKNMHADMAGGAAVLGAAEAIGELKPDGVEVHFIVPTAENTVGRDAFRPQDIIRGYGGKTVEIDNTDAEGRLLLADALSYAQKQEIDTIVDAATLTGACVVALGDYTGGLFTDDAEMEEQLMAAAEASGDDLWPLPLNDRLDDQLDTEVADMKNVGKRMGGAITAGLFLGRWVELDRWAHLDIAGPAYATEPAETNVRGGTGFGVGTLTRYALAAASG